MTRTKFAWVLWAVVLASPQVLPAQTAVVEAVARRTAAGVTPAGRTSGFALTPDGRFLLVHSTASDVVPGQLDSNGVPDVFLRDRQASGPGATQLVSALPGTLRTPDRESYPLGLSNDGRFVLFQSYATNLLAPGSDTNGQADLFVRDLLLDELHTVTHQAADPGRAADAGGGEEGGQISADGRYVAFGSASQDLVTGLVDTNLGYDAFLFDRLSGTVSLMSYAAGSPTTTAGPGETLPRAISADGRFVLLETSATNLVAGVVNPQLATQVYRFDRTTGLSQLASHSTSGGNTGANSGCQAVAISPDGRWALFESTATDLVAGTDTNGVGDVFLADLDSGAVVLVSHSAAGAVTAGNQTSLARALSPNGRYVLFDSFASNLIPGGTDTNNNRDVFVFDRLDASVRLVSRSSSSPVTAGNGASLASALSDDGQQVAFISAASDLAGTDNNGATDVFTWSRATGTVTLRSTTRGSTSTVAAGSSCCALASADGSELLFLSAAPELDPPDRNLASDVFEPGGAPGFVAAALRREAAVATTLPSGSSAPAMSPDGRFVLVGARGEELFPGAVTGSGPIAAVYDRFGHGWQLVTHAAGLPGTLPNGASGPKAISADGRYVVFDSLATDLVPGFVAAGFGESVFRYDRVTHQTILLSHAAGSTTQETNSNSLGLAISADGRWALFDSGGSNVVPGQSGPAGLVLYDGTTRTGQLVAHVLSSPTTGSSPPANFVALSADGRFVLYDSTASNLVAGDANALSDVFVFDRMTGQNEAMSVQAANPAATGNGISRAWGLSPDGRYVLFASLATNLIAGGSGPPGQNAFLRDRVLGTTVLLSHQSGQPTAAGNGTSWPVAVSSDGRFVLFASNATDLLPTSLGSPGAIGNQVYVYDRQTGGPTLLSHAAGQPFVAANGSSIPRGLTASGHGALFSSNATTLDGEFPTGGDQLYLTHLATGATRRLTVREADTARPVVGVSTAIQLAADGNTVLFRSLADTLVQGDANAVEDAFLSSTTILSDGFESGDASHWTLASPPLP